MAKSYAANGYIIKLEVNTSECYICNDKEFWSISEPFSVEQDLDPMGNYINLPGSKLRNKLLKNGYTTLLYDDDETGKVSVLLDNKAARIINCIEINKKLKIKK